MAQLRAKFQATHVWSSGEQSGVSAASDETLRQLAAGNQAYLDKFGYIFIVCATGKTAAEMLEILNSRLPNSPEQEILIAAAEQEKITAIRLRKLPS
jgi:2-oxo-4-hydroxy-4-carboxy-5-ureidoimidazoline decarboxylase